MLCSYRALGPFLILPQTPLTQALGGSRRTQDLAREQGQAAEGGGLGARE